MTSDALISSCGQYRYWLTREWDEGSFSLPIIMLNPSTADASEDDPTIRRCIAFAKREGFGGVRVMNLFAFRSPSPVAMKASADPIGPESFRHFETLFAHVASNTEHPVLCAWGSHGGHMGRDAAIIKEARYFGARLVCLGTTKDGHPRHPLYVKGDQAFEPFRGAFS